MRTNSTKELHMCEDCGRPFIVPVSVLDLVDNDRCVVELQCTNCGRISLAVHDDASLEELDRQLDHTTADMRVAAELLSYLEDVERADRFAQALHDDLILPEDF